MVFSNLVGYKDPVSSRSRHPILACRLVNQHWKSVVESVMERAIISFFKKLDSETDSLDEKSRIEIIESIIPSLSLKMPNGHPFTFKFQNLWCPRFLQNFQEGNPFPFKSLQIGPYVESRPKSYFSTSVFEFMVGWNLGHHLTSFTLCCCYCMTPYHFKLLFQEMPNLKALKICEVTLIIANENFPDKFQLPSLPQLKVLQLSNNEAHSDSDKYLDPTVMNIWIANVYGKTLTHLQINEDFSFARDKFPNLTNLKIVAGNKTFKNSECLPLERLSITVDTYDYDGDWLDEVEVEVEIPDLTPFLERLAPTLVRLELTGNCTSDGIQYEASDIDSGKPVIVLPLLKFFLCPFPLNDREKVAIKRCFLRRFPALEKLEFTTGFRSADVETGRGKITDFLARENFWAVCEKLKSIQVFGCTYVKTQFV